MGVHGLWELLLPAGRRVDSAHVSRKTVAVDVSIWLTQFVRAMRETDGELVPNAHLLGVLRRVCKLLFLGVRPVFVFDGGTPALKRRTLAARAAARDGNAARLRRNAEKLLLNRLKGHALATISGLPTPSPPALAAAPSTSGELAPDAPSAMDRFLEGAVAQADDIQPAAPPEGMRPGASVLAAFDEDADVFVMGDGDASASGGEDAEDDDYAVGTVALPDDLRDLDEGALAALPARSQAAVFREIKARQRAAHREGVLAMQRNDPASFSRAQIKAFIANTALNRRIAHARNTVNDASGPAKRIASDASRAYVMEEKPDEIAADFGEEDMGRSRSESEREAGREASDGAGEEEEEDDVLRRLRKRKDATGAGFSLRTRDSRAAREQASASRESSGVAWASKVLLDGGEHQLGGRRTAGFHILGADDSREDRTKLSTAARLRRLQSRYDSDDEEDSGDESRADGKLVATGIPRVQSNRSGASPTERISLPVERFSGAGVAVLEGKDSAEIVVEGLSIEKEGVGSGTDDDMEWEEVEVGGRGDVCPESRVEESSKTSGGVQELGARTLGKSATREASSPLRVPAVGTKAPSSFSQRALPTVTARGTAGRPSLDDLQRAGIAAFEDVFGVSTPSVKVSQTAACERPVDASAPVKGASHLCEGTGHGVSIVNGNCVQDREEGDNGRPFMFDMPSSGRQLPPRERGESPTDLLQRRSGPFNQKRAVGVEGHVAMKPRSQLDGTPTKSSSQYPEGASRKVVCVSGKEGSPGMSSPNAVSKLQESTDLGLSAPQDSLESVPATDAGEPEPSPPVSNSDVEKMHAVASNLVGKHAAAFASPSMSTSERPDDQQDVLQEAAQADEPAASKRVRFEADVEINVPSEDPSTAPPEEVDGVDSREMQVAIEASMSEMQRGLSRYEREKRRLSRGAEEEDRDLQAAIRASLATAASGSYVASGRTDLVSAPGIGTIADDDAHDDDDDDDDESSHDDRALECGAQEEAPAADEESTGGNVASNYGTATTAEKVGGSEDPQRMIAHAEALERNDAGLAEVNRLSDADIRRLQAEIGAESASLRRENRTLRGATESLSEEMYSSTRDMLRLLGLPYLEAPMEAEAQCAYLNEIGLVDAVLTEDSDAFLFGAKVVYRRLFADGKFAEAYDVPCIESELGIDRERIVKLALLLGSDYTPGVRGVGIVNSMEILQAFGGKDGLQEFKTWAQSVSLADTEPTAEEADSSGSEAIRRKFCWKHRNMKRNWEIPESFPSQLVVEAYMKPTVDKSRVPFRWKDIDVKGLREFCWKKFAWGPEKFDETLGPVLNQAKAFRGKGRYQAVIEDFFKPHRFAKIRSERLQEAVKGIAGAPAEPLMAGPRKRTRRSVLDDEDGDDSGLGQESQHRKSGKSSYLKRSKARRNGRFPSYEGSDDDNGGAVEVAQDSESIIEAEVLGEG